jgi:hypothetical protein
MGEKITSLHEATMIKWSILAWRKHEALSSRSNEMHKAKVLVRRLGYRIHNRTIKRGFGWVTWSHRLRELNPLHTLHLPILLFIGVFMCKVLELVYRFPTSPCSSKMEFVYIIYCVSSWEVLPVLRIRRFHTYLNLVFSLLKILGVSPWEVLYLFSNFPTSLG